MGSLDGGCDRRIPGLVNYVIELADESVRVKLLQCHADIYQNLEQKNEPAMLLAIDRHYDLIEQMV